MIQVHRDTAHGGSAEDGVLTRQGQPTQCEFADLRLAGGSSANCLVLSADPDVQTTLTVRDVDRGRRRSALAQALPEISEAKLRQTFLPNLNGSTAEDPSVPGNRQKRCMDQAVKPSFRKECCPETPMTGLSVRSPGAGTRWYRHAGHCWHSVHFTG